MPKSGMCGAGKKRAFQVVRTMTRRTAEDAHVDLSSVILEQMMNRLEDQMPKFWPLRKEDWESDDLNRCIVVLRCEISIEPVTLPQNDRTSEK